MEAGDGNKGRQCMSGVGFALRGCLGQVINGVQEFVMHVLWGFCLEVRVVLLSSPMRIPVIGGCAGKDMVGCGWICTHNSQHTARQRSICCSCGGYLHPGRCGFPSAATAAASPC